ncbi:flagellin [Pseudobacteriovorax antillogorgiicola]|uniref:Flagellin n=1 Tax=Pseudobacteriovorax antillogorgiicola TaxID=1513793 RepID=A0A1Y6CRB1_9BACT|nr:flagellin [Pseudobacteriovorax antillogorgiicola]TCS46166.1 flagellin [Pseudobacteriovorax antillogorgiicola]SMF69936.1 flagellin [Pseudobacteriovorax antillogorgiicola]
MGVRIKTNVESLIAQNKLSENRRDLNSSLEKLASGQRINKSADDAAGLAVSERIRARIASLDVAKRNANDGVSYIQVAEGSLNEITNILVRMRELGSQAASDTLGNRERQFLDREFQQLTQEVARISASTEFNGRKVLDAEGNSEAMRIFVGASNRASVDGSSSDIDPDEDPDVITINLEELETLNDSLIEVTDGGLAIVPDDEDGGAADLGPDGTSALFETLDTALNDVASYRATLGSVQSRLNSAIQNIEVSTENLSAANSRIRDVDFAAETAKFTQSKILTAAGASVLAHANAQPELVLQMLR